MELNIITKTKVHDLTRHVWGNGISIYTPKGKKDGNQFSVVGHSRERIAKGDWLAINSETQSYTCYKVDSIRYYSDPKDMFEAEISFVPLMRCPICGLRSLDDKALRKHYEDIHGE